MNLCDFHQGNLFKFFISIRNSHKLTTYGPYSIIRHPRYFGRFMYIWCDSTYFNSLITYIQAIYFTNSIIKKIIKYDVIVPVVVFKILTFNDLNNFVNE